MYICIIGSGYMKQFKKNEEGKEKSKKVLYGCIGTLLLVAVFFSVKTFCEYIYTSDSVVLTEASVYDYKEAQYTSYDDSKTSFGCDNVQCALDKLYDTLKG